MLLPKKMREKLSNSNGETLVEVLVAVLVSAMAMLMLAVAITCAMNITKQSNNAAKDYYDYNKLLASPSFVANDGVHVDGGTAMTSKNVNIKYEKEDLPGGELVLSYEAN